MLNSYRATPRGKARTANGPWGGAVDDDLAGEGLAVVVLRHRPGAEAERQGQGDAEAGRVRPVEAGPSPGVDFGVWVVVEEADDAVVVFPSRVSGARRLVGFGRGQGEEEDRPIGRPFPRDEIESFVGRPAGHPAGIRQEIIIPAQGLGLLAEDGQGQVVRRSDDPVVAGVEDGHRDIVRRPDARVDGLDEVARLAEIAGRREEPAPAEVSDESDQEFVGPGTEDVRVDPPESRAFPAEERALFLRLEPTVAVVVPTIDQASRGVGISPGQVIQGQRPVISGRRDPEGRGALSGKGEVDPEAGGHIEPLDRGRAAPAGGSGRVEAEGQGKTAGQGDHILGENRDFGRGLGMAERGFIANDLGRRSFEIADQEIVLGRQPGPGE